MSADRQGETDRLLAGIRFVPRASLGPEIAGRVRRGETSTGGFAPWRSAIRYWLPVAAAMVLTVPAGVLAWRGLATPVLRGDHCCQDLDGGGNTDDGYVVEARGRRIERLTLYEDIDGDGRLSTADRVRLARGATPVLADDSVHSSIRICCVDLDGEGPADDGLLVLSGPGEHVVLAGIFEQRARTSAAELR